VRALVYRTIFSFIANMKTSIIDEQQFFAALSSQANHFFNGYFAFYSSWLGGIVKNPSMMVLPIDDHMVHRGDGVFETMKAHARSIYLFEEHMQRLVQSAEKIALKPPFALAEIKEIVLDTLRAANQEEACIRIFISRGPGDFTANPYDSIQSQLYIVVSALKTPGLTKYLQGVVIGKSTVPMKSPWMTQIKSCNYLPNVLMKKEAVDRKLDFVIATDMQDNITESATENIMIVDSSGTLIHPPLDYILKGTTMIRVAQLAREHGMKTKIHPISLSDLHKAQEVFITGTTLNVLPVIQFEDQPIGDGTPGLIAKKLNELLIHDIQSGQCNTPY